MAKRVALLMIVLFALVCDAAQCQATTKKGSQCKRQAEGSLYCWQHGRKADVRVQGASDAGGFSVSQGSVKGGCIPAHGATAATEEGGSENDLHKENEALRRENQKLRRELVRQKEGQPVIDMSARAPEPGVKKAAPPEKVVDDGGWWLSSSGKRHNSKCRYYKTGKGRSCGKGEGVPCKKCGG